MQESISASAPTESAFVPQAREVSSLHVLRLAWKPNAPGDPAVAFAASIASHLFDACSAVLVETRDHELLDDLDLDELVTSVRSGTVEAAVFRTGRVDLTGEWWLELAPPGQDARCRLGVPVCDDEQPWTQVSWLQASVDHPSPMPALAVPRGPGGVSVSVFHGLVVLAARFGQVDLAELERCAEPARPVTVARWRFVASPENAIPVIAHEGEALWLATPTPLSTAAKPACWV